MTAVAIVGAVALAGAAGAQLVRWLRVLQREHYVALSASRFLARWTTPAVARAGARRPNRRPVTLSHVLLMALIITLIVSSAPGVVIVSVLYGAACPVGLGLRGRTGRLRWTRRATTTASVAGAMAIVVEAVSVVAHAWWLGAVIVIWSMPLLVDLAARLLRPQEDRRARIFVERARARLAAVQPRIVAITGSYGKTSTKQHLAHLLGDAVATPASYNNRAGLSRAINENLAEGTSVFIAEMGTYGPGEIRDLCSWCPPEVAVVTAIGPVHLERMGSLATIEAAKHEITERASTVVVNGDDERLRGWVEPLRARGTRVLVGGSSSAPCDVRVRVVGGQWEVEGPDGVASRVATVPGLQPTNLACALAAGLALGRAWEDLTARLASMPAVASRANVVIASSGATVIDDTFNANPASARAALDLLMASGVTGRRVLVTPGMVELGRLQHGENLALGRRAAFLGVELIVVGRTNAAALVAGYGTAARRVDRRDQAVAWVRSTLGQGDGVLYLNDLPDHYP